MNAWNQFGLGGNKNLIPHLVTWSPCHLVILLACIGCSRTKSTDELIADLKAPQGSERTVAVRLLAQRKADAARVVPALIAALNDKDSEIRRSAALGLGSFADQATDAIAALAAARHDRDARVREAAGVALARIDPKAAANTPPVP